MRRILNLWPPFLFAGIRVTAIGADWRSASVELRMRPWNRNYVGTHFGGSLFAMTDPFWMILVMRALGGGHVVWDRAGTIEFLRPGRGTVRAHFELDDATVQDIRDAAARGALERAAGNADAEAAAPPALEGEGLQVLPSGAVLRWFRTDVVDEAGDVVARVRKQVYVRRKGAAAGAAAAP